MCVCVGVCIADNFPIQRDSHVRPSISRNKECEFGKLKYMLFLFVISTIYASY